MKPVGIISGLWAGCLAHAKEFAGSCDRKAARNGAVGRGCANGMRKAASSSSGVSVALAGAAGGVHAAVQLGAAQGWALLGVALLVASLGLGVVAAVLGPEDERN